MISSSITHALVEPVLDATGFECRNIVVLDPPGDRNLETYISNYLHPQDLFHKFSISNILIPPVPILFTNGKLQPESLR